MSGHGWVTPNPDGSKARCGGPAICGACAREKAAAEAAIAARLTETAPAGATPAETMRRAAALMRERAEAATPGPWWSDESGDCWRLHGVAFRTPPFLGDDGSVIIPGQVMNKQIAKAPKHGTPYAEYWPESADDAWITSMHPLVGAVLADLLEEIARQYDAPPCDSPDGVCNGCERREDFNDAVRLARAYLGEEAP